MPPTPICSFLGSLLGAVETQSHEVAIYTPLASSTKNNENGTAYLPFPFLPAKPRKNFQLPVMLAVRKKGKVCIFDFQHSAIEFI
jgi:hypothetical protein